MGRDAVDLFKIVMTVRLRRGVLKTCKSKNPFTNNIKSRFFVLVWLSVAEATPTLLEQHSVNGH